jgi:hypothetical protein
MDDEPREQIFELEVQIEELTDALERCRKTALASKAAMCLGGILMAVTTLGVVTFDPMLMVAGPRGPVGRYRRFRLEHVDYKPAFGGHEKRRGAASGADRPAQYLPGGPANRDS